MKIPTKRELLQIVSNHSTDCEWKDFSKRYKELFYFWVNDITLPIDNLLRLRNCYEMAVGENIKTIDNKIEQNKTQYNLNSQVVNISYFSSWNVG